MKRSSSSTGTSTNNVAHTGGGSTVNLHGAHNNNHDASPSTTLKGGRSSNTLNPQSATESLVKCVSQLSLSASNLNQDEQKNGSATKINTSCATLTVDSKQAGKNKSNTTLHVDDAAPHHDEAKKNHSDFKLVSLYGDWCAFE
jgi:hypothetical protein